MQRASVQQARNAEAKDHKDRHLYSMHTSSYTVWILLSSTTFLTIPPAPFRLAHSINSPQSRRAAKQPKLRPGPGQISVTDPIRPPMRTPARSRTAAAAALCLVLPSLLAGAVLSFSVGRGGAVAPRRQTPTCLGALLKKKEKSTPLFAKDAEPESDPEAEREARKERARAECGPAAETHFGPDLGVLAFELAEHKPLGCTAEESLVADEENGGCHHVFISKVTRGGNADGAGLEEGDVIVGVSGSFDEVVVVAGLGLERARDLIAGHPEAEPLSVVVVRGTAVQELHDTALVDLCTFNEGQDKMIEECIINLNSGYDIFEEEETPEEACGEDEAECLIDQLYSSWDEDMPGGGEKAAEESPAEEGAKKKKPPPWSSRSSPSGTFVRNPKTGKMENIDA